MASTTQAKDVPIAIHTLIQNIISSTEPSPEDPWDLSDILKLLNLCWSDKSPETVGQRLPTECRIPIRKALVVVSIKRMELMMRSPYETKLTFVDFSEQYLLEELDRQLQISFREAGLNLPVNYDKPLGRRLRSIGSRA